MELTFTDEQTTDLFGLLGLPTDDTSVTVDAVLAVIKDLAAQAAGGDTDKAKPKPSEVAAAAKRLGLETVDEETLEGLRRDAAEGRRIAAAARRRDLETTVDTAIARGKITPSRRDHWITLIEADSGMAQVLASVPDETVVSLSEIGHTVTPDGAAEPSDWFR